MLQEKLQEKLQVSLALPLAPRHTGSHFASARSFP
jgi:hypothetical protein